MVQGLEKEWGTLPSMALQSLGGNGHVHGGSPKPSEQAGIWRIHLCSENRGCRGLGKLRGIGTRSQGVSGIERKEQVEVF